MRASGRTLTVRELLAVAGPDAEIRLDLGPVVAESAQAVVAAEGDRWDVTLTPGQVEVDLDEIAEWTSMVEFVHALADGRHGRSKVAMEAARKLLVALGLDGLR